MEEIDYKRSIELLNKDVDACLEIIDNWKKSCAYLVSIGVMPPDQWGVPLVEKLVPYERYPKNSNRQVYWKTHSNRVVRRYRGYLPKGNGHRKLFEYVYTIY